MSRPTAKPAIKKAPTRVHPVAPAGRGQAEAKAVEADKRVMHSVRINIELRRALKRHAIDEDMTLEEITESALEAYLAAHQSSR